MENREKAFAWIASCLCMFCAPTAAQYVGDPHEYVEYIVKADHADRIYETGEKATVTVEAYKGGIPLDGVKLYYSTGDEMMLPEPNDSTTFRDGKAVIDMGTSHAPDFKDCDLTGFAHQRAGGWPKYFKEDGRTMADTQVIETLQYYDVVNFARILQVPGYYAFGFNDDTCSPTSIYSMLNEIKAPKTVHHTYTNAHFNFSETEALASEWILREVGLEPGE